MNLGSFWGALRKSSRLLSHLLMSSCFTGAGCSAWRPTNSFKVVTDWSIDGLIDGLIDWLIDWLMDWSMDWLIELVGWLVDWLVGWLIDWLIDWLMDWWIDWLIDLCRFRTDAADLEFIEKVARWLTNTQVQIKTEVASSNTQCQAIEQSVNKLQYLLSSDRQSDGSQDDVVVDTLRSLFELVHGRAAYLRCLDEAGTRRRGTEVNRSSLQNEAAAAAACTTILQFLLWHREGCKVLHSLYLYLSVSLSARVSGKPHVKLHKIFCTSIYIDLYSPTRGSKENTIHARI